MHGHGANPYAASTNFGWSNRPAPTFSNRQNDVALPLGPSKPHGGMKWRHFGLLLSFLAAATIGLGIANIVVTYVNYMVNQNCASNPTLSYCDPNLLKWTWIPSGIAGSMPSFILGLMAIRTGSKKNRGMPMKHRSCFEFFLFIATFLATPFIIGLSAVEVIMDWPVYYTGRGDLVKVIIPIVIAALGFLQHILTAWALIYICCCDKARKSKSSFWGTMENSGATNPTAQNDWPLRSKHCADPGAAYAAPAGQCFYQPACGPRTQMFPAGSAAGMCNHGYCGTGGNGGLLNSPSFFSMYPSMGHTPMRPATQYGSWMPQSNAYANFYSR